MGKRSANPDKPHIRKIINGLYFCQSKTASHTGYGTSFRRAHTAWVGMMHEVKNEPTTVEHDMDDGAKPA